MKAATRRYLLDLAERIAATAAEAGVSYTITVVADLDPVWAMPLTVGLSALKGWLARFVGRRDSAALVVTSGHDTPAPDTVD